MINFVNLDSGDFGRPTLYEGKSYFPLEIIRIAHILGELRGTLVKNKWNHTIPSYAFSFPLDQKDRLIELMEDLDKLFPQYVTWYEIDGKKLFESRGPSGGIATSLVCYLIAK